MHAHAALPDGGHPRMHACMHAHAALPDGARKRWCRVLQINVVDSDLGKALLERIANEGHTVGSHTVDHISLDDLDTTRIEYELSGVEQELGDLGIPTPRVRAGPGTHSHPSCPMKVLCHPSSTHAPAPPAGAVMRGVGGMHAPHAGTSRCHALVLHLRQCRREAVQLD